MMARHKAIEVVYVRHDGGTGEALQSHASRWQFGHCKVLLEQEKVFDKQYNSVFKETGLHEYLQSKGNDTIVLMGMQSEYCIDTTCKVTFELQ